MIGSSLVGQLTGYLGLVTLLSAVSLGTTGGTAAGADLERSFANPPPSARPWVYWFWMNGNVTKEGITADLEAMARVGIGGTLIMSVSNGIPPGRVDFMSPGWRELFAHAVREADRLGLQINMNNDDGWCGSGGPWMKAEDSMQILTSSRLWVEGPRQFDGQVPQPPIRKTKIELGEETAAEGFYRDIALFALPGGGPRMRDLAPKITAGAKRADAASLMDGDLDTGVQLPKPSPQAPQQVCIEFSKPLVARSLSIFTGPGRQNHGGRLEVSDDGKKFRLVREFQIPSSGITATAQGITFAATKGRVFRLVFDKSPAKTGPLVLREIELNAEAQIDSWPLKAGQSRSNGLEPDLKPSTAPAGCTPRAALINLSDKLDAAGRLRWNVPAGSWTILRVGRTTTGKTNHPATPAGTGLECDKLSKEALDKHFQGMLGKLVADAGPLTGKAFAATHIDSWEVGCQNWTPRFPEEFCRRRGYDPLPYLPAMVGVPLESTQVSERFLWDVRRTLADLIADNYVGHLRELAHQHGMSLSIEAYGNGNFDDLQCSSRSDIPMSEFWTGQTRVLPRDKGAASTGHQRGQAVIGAEAFTAKPENGKWQNHPYKLKTLGDSAFCCGINRFVFHRWAMQPWLDRWPGMTFGPHGIQFERTVTWFEQSRAWLAYLARCQYLLQQGQFVADTCYWSGESPTGTSWCSALQPPRDRDFDACCSEMLQAMEVKDGRLTLPSGMIYRLLVLPESRFITPQSLRKLHELVVAGACVLGAKPEQSPSLQDYPACDDEVRRIAGQLWGDPSKPGMRGVGKGRVYWGQTVDEVFGDIRLLPDCHVEPDPAAEDLCWIHRRSGNADLYFVANQMESAITVDAIFRIAGKRPELWHPDTGRREPAAVWHATSDGRTAVRLRLDPAGSVFVVFRGPAGDSDAVIDIARNGVPLAQCAVPEKLLIRKAVYGVPGDPKRTRDVTAPLAERVVGGKLSIRVWKDLAGDPAPGVRKTLRVEYSCGGVDAVASAQDGHHLNLPDRVALISAPAPAEVQWSGDGLQLLAWEPGRYEVRTAAGQTLACQAGELPKPLAIAGPWKVTFPARWGGPDSIQLDKLISWPEHANPGVKYFSGTAVYLNTFELPENYLGDGKVQTLDLGQVAVIAEVKLNGHDLGILWKPPFAVDVSGLARPGKNELEVRVTNLWPNRLIGDEQKPPYLKWMRPTPSSGPAEWPDWVAGGGAVPDTGRITFTTWHHYSKDSPLLPSGLLGPVTLRAAQEVLLKRAQ